MTKQEAAAVVVGNMGEESELPQISVVLVDIVVQILEWIIPICAQWVINSKVLGQTKPGLFKMMVLRRQVKNAFRKQTGNLVAYRTQGEPMVRAIVQSYEAASVEDVKSLFATE